MSWLKKMGDGALRHTIARLVFDIEDFRARAAAVATALERDGRPVNEDALYQRLTGIEKHLSLQLIEAQEELSLRGKASAERDRSRWPFPPSTRAAIVSGASGEE